MRKVIFNLVLILLFVFAVNLQAAELAYWKFDDKEPVSDAVAGERILDSSGNGRDAYVSSASVPQFWAPSPVHSSDGAALNSAVGEKVVFEPGYDFGDGGAVAGTALGEWAYDDSFTIEAVVRFPVSNDSGNKYCSIAAKFGGTTEPIAEVSQWWLRIRGNGDAHFQMTDESGYGASVSVAVEDDAYIYDGQWHHVAVVRNVSSDNLKLYVDYVEVDSVTDSTYDDFTQDGNTIYIGAFRDTDTRDFIGSMDCLRISDTALSPSEFIQTKHLAADPAPADRAYDISTPSTTLSWTPVSGSGITVSAQTVEVATDPDFNDIFQTFNLSGTANSANLSSISAGRIYYWRVNAAGTDNGNAFDDTGLGWSFMTVDANTAVAGYWKFDDINPGTVLAEADKITDSSGNQRHMYLFPTGGPNSLYGNPDPAYGTGGSYLGYDGAYMTLIPGYDWGSEYSGSPIILPADGDMTIEAVVKFSSTDSTYNSIFSTRTSHTDLTYWYDTEEELWLRAEGNGKLRFFIKQLTTSDTVSSVTGATAVYDDQWHHVAAVRDVSAGTLKVYVDYVEDGSVVDFTAVDVMPRGGYSELAGWKGYTSRNLGGNIDFVKVSRDALTPSEFMQVTDANLPSNPDPNDGEENVPLSSTFTWTPAPGVSISSQTVKIATDPYMQNIVQTITASGNSAAVSGLSNNIDYSWRVDTVGTEDGSPIDRQGPVWGFSTPSCVLVAEDGDLNGDCIIDFLDFAIMAGNWLDSEFEE